MVKTVSDSDFNLVQAGIGRNCEIHSTAIARLYKADPSTSSWVKEAMGAVVIATDPAENSHFLYLYDLSTKQTKFRQELYEKFSYQKPKPFFHTFEADSEVVGFSFADEEEASTFYSAVVDCASSSSSSDSRGPTSPPPVSRPPLPSNPVSAPSRPAPPVARRPPAPVSPRPPPPGPAPVSPVSTPTPTPISPMNTYSAPSPPPQNNPPPPPVPTTTTTTSMISSPSSGSGNFGTLKKTKSQIGLFSKISGFFKAEDTLADIPISEPRNFRHLSSIGWNPSEANFEIRNIPPEWRKLFQQAGIKKSDLKNTNTAQAIINIIEANGGVDDAPPPPPPPMDDAPPPPPGPGPSTSSGSGLGRGALLSQIQQGRELKKVDATNEPKAPTVANPNDLVSTLAKAMADRRPAFNEEQEEEEWSNEEWE